LSGLLALDSPAMQAQNKPLSAEDAEQFRAILNPSNLVGFC
jgi:hypothetical protein